MTLIKIGIVHSRILQQNKSIVDLQKSVLAGTKK